MSLLYPAPAILSVALALSAAVPSLAAAEAPAALDIHIPAQALGPALNALAAQADLQLMVDSGLVSGKRAPAVSGRLTPQQALDKILAGSGLAAVVRGRAVVVQPARTDESAVPTLPSVAVNAASVGETALGPVDGYVARRSLTATKTDVPLQEVPQSVSVVTREQMETQNAQTLVQALQYTPGVHGLTGDANSTTSDGMQMRGFNVTGSAPMYLNGAKLSRNVFAGVAEPYALERIEVLRGPASVLYGSTAPGGVVNMVSKLPAADMVREIQLRTDTYGRAQVAADLGGAIDEGSEWTYRLTGLSRRSDTMLDHVDDDRDFLSGALTWRPDTDTSLTLLANWQHNDTTYVYGLPREGVLTKTASGRISRSRFVGEPGFNGFDSRNHMLGYLLSHRINEQIELRQNFIYFDSESRYGDIWIGALDVAQRTVSRGAYHRTDQNRSWSLDNQVQVKGRIGDTEHTVVAGVDFTKARFERLQYNGTVAALDLYAPVYGAPVTMSTNAAIDNEEHTRQTGFYLQDHIKFDQRWVLLLGGRYDRVDGYLRNHLNSVRTDNYDDSALTGRAGLVYLFDNGVAPYLSYSESFEPTNGQDVSGRSFEPTKGEQYEIGVKVAPPGTRTSFTAAVYDLTRRNVTTTDLANPGFSIQHGEVRSRGLELEARAHLNRQLSVIAAYTYTDAEITRSNTGNEGERPGGVPRHMASLWADYRFGESMPGLGVGAGMRYFGDTENNANTYVVPSYTVTDARIDYRLDRHWQLAMNVENLFDKRYAVCTYACFYGQERRATVTAAYRW